MTTTDTVAVSIEPLRPRSPRTEADEDRLHAGAAFAHGRSLVHADRREEALRQFQRAFRLDPTPRIGQEVVTLASQLGRGAVAVRYAILNAELRPPRAELSRKLAAVLAERGDYPRALELLRRTVADVPPAGWSAVQLRVDLLRMHLVLDQSQPAAVLADWLQEVLRDPQRFALTADDQVELAVEKNRWAPILAECYLQVGRPADAEAVYRAWQKTQPDEARLHVDLARVAAARQDWPAAREGLEAYFQTGSDVAGLEAWELYARVVESASPVPERQDRVLEALQKWEETQPDNDLLRFFTAERLAAAGRVQEAIGRYRRLLERQPRGTLYRALAELYRREQRAEDLLRLIGRALLQADSGDWLGEVCRPGSVEPKLWASLQERLPEVVEKSPPPERSAVYIAGALLALAAEQPPAAAQLVEQALPPRGKSDQLRAADAKRYRELFGFSALRANQPELAIAAFRQLLEAPSDPVQAAAYRYFLVGALVAAERPAEGLPEAERAAEMQPRDPRYQVRPAWVLFQQRQYAAAEKRYRDFVTAWDERGESPDHRDLLREARLTLSHLCVLRDAPAEAEEWLEQVLDEFPESTAASNDLGYLWADQGRRLQRALRLIEKAVRDDPENASYRDSLGWAYYRLGRYAEAVRELERSAAAEPEPVVHQHLGDAYWKVGDKPRALAAWRRGWEQATSPDDADVRATLASRLADQDRPTRPEARN